MRSAGLDALVLNRVFLMGTQIFAPLAVLGCAVLLPIYLTAGAAKVGGSRSVEEGASTSALLRTTIANVAAGSPLLWVPFALTYVVVGW